MAYIKNNLGSYGGLAGIWGRGPLPSITIPAQPSGSFILPGRADPYWGYPAGRPYIGMRPPPPLFGPKNPPFVLPEETLPDFYPRHRSNLPSPALYELWDARNRLG
jgi:hypothetical protein